MKAALSEFTSHGVQGTCICVRGSTHDQLRLQSWAYAYSEHVVLVMTPQVLVDCLSRKNITMDNLSLMVFDEAHHCVKRHPYAQIMEFYHAATAPKPHVFGMTACPVNVKVQSSLRLFCKHSPGIALHMPTFA